MPALTIVPNFNHVFMNPTWVYGNVGLPGAGARLAVAITTEGIPTPDTGAGNSPNAFWLGTSKEGAKLSIGHEIDTLEVDEYEGEVDERVKKTVSSLEGELYEALDLVRLQKILPGTELVTVASGVGTVGYEQIRGGGLLTVPKIPICALSIDPADPTLVICAMLYAASNKAGLALPMSGKSRATVPYKFEGKDVVGRAKGDRHWTFWKQKAAL